MLKFLNKIDKIVLQFFLSYAKIVPRGTIYSLRTVSSSNEIVIFACCLSTRYDFYIS